MNCPKCKTELEDNCIKCPECGVRIGRLCPTCNTYNLITNKNCSNCGETLLKICPACKSINMPTAINCRKCGQELEETEENITVQDNIIIDSEIETEQPTEQNESYDQQGGIAKYDANYCSLNTAKNTLLESIKAKNLKVISLNGENTLGKNYIIKNLLEDLSKSQIAWLTGKCTPYTQLTPLGFIQDVLLHLFNITNFCPSKKQLKKESIKFFKEDFGNLETKEIYDLLNILYPEDVDKFQNIQNNKQRTIRMIVKVFETIASKMDIALYIDDIEYIDDLSYEILNILLSREDLKEKLTYILTCSKEQSGINCITNVNLTENNYVDITIAPQTSEQIEPIFANYQKLNLSKDLKSKILYFSKSDPIHTEQLLSLVSDCNKIGNEIKLFSELKDTLQFRLDLLKQSDYSTYLILCACAILGCKFYPIILNSIFDMDLESIKKTLHKLIKNNYIIAHPNSCYEFKSLKIWNIIIDQIKTDSEIFRAVNQALYQILTNYTLSTSAVLGFIAQNLNYEDQTFTIWTKCTQMAAYIGDTSLYIILQKQILSIIDNINLTQSQLVKRTIYSELGKLLEPDNPELALDYLPKAIMLLSDSEFNEKIEILGFLSSCAMKTKNHHGVIECINQVIPIIPDNFKTEIAMVKSRQLKAFEKLGNTGTIVNIIDNDIIPHLENALMNHSQCKTITADKIFKTWLKTHLRLAKALAIQGDNRVFKIINTIFEVFDANKIQDNKLIMQTQIELAFANTISGNIRSSINILSEVLTQDEDPNIIDESMMSYINLISVLNKLFMNSEDLTYDELFQAAQYAGDVGDDFTKNILKLILGRLMQDRTSAKEAINIYTKQIEYFAETQNAVGVLLGWYFVSEAKFMIDGPKSALDIATKALDIAQGANIMNHYFILLLNKLIGEMYLALQDYDSAKMYIEKAILIAKNFDLQYQLVNLYLLYGKYLQDMAITSKDKKVEYVLSAQEMNKKAEDISNDLKIISLNSEVEKATTVLKSFCQMNGIILK